MSCSGISQRFRLGDLYLSMVLRSFRSKLVEIHELARYIKTYIAHHNFDQETLEAADELKNYIEICIEITKKIHEVIK